MTPKEISEQIRIHSQKYILPIYLKDELENLKFSATLTLVKYKNRYFGITAAHAIPNTYDINRGIYVFDINILFLSNIHRFDENDDLDLLIIDFHGPNFTDTKKYFDLNKIELPDPDNFHLHAFSWHGFPAKKAIDFHKKNVRDIVHKTLNNNLITTSKTLLIGIPFKKNLDLANDLIEGEFSLKNVNYEKEGYKSRGYSLKGMSGGAICIHKKELSPLENSLYFIGIGIEHRKDNTIIGISRKIILDKLEDISKIPLSFDIVLNPDFYEEK